MNGAPFAVLALFTLVAPSRQIHTVKQDIVTGFKDKEIKYNLYENKIT